MQEAIRAHLTGGGARLSPHSFLVITGPSGCGKSYGIRAILEDLKADIWDLNSESCATTREFLDVFHKAATSGLMRALNGSAGASASPKCILIDNADAWFAADRYLLGAIVDLIKGIKNWPHIPVIVCGLPGLEKKFAGLGVTGYACSAPSDEEIAKLLKKKLKIRIAAARVIAKKAGGNITYALALANGGDAKDDSTAGANPFTNVQVALAMLQDDPWLSPLRLHENALRELGERKGRAEAKRAAYEKFSQAMCEWDAAMARGATDVALVNLAHAAVALVRDFEVKKRAGGYESAFTRLFSQLSLHKKNERTAYAESDFPWADAQFFLSRV